MERRVGQVLLAAVIIAAASLIAGLTMWMLAAPRGLTLMEAGLIVLMATPVLRVVLSVVESASARDWTFAAASAVVLAILIASIVYSRSA
jgi:uncharacterized membrane protein